MDPGRTPRHRRLLLVAVSVLVPALLAMGGLVAYLTGAFTDRGRFDTVPPGCDTIRPYAGLLGVDYTLRPAPRNYSCDLLLPPDHPRYLAAPKMTVGFVIPPGEDRSPAAAAGWLKDLENRVPVPGLGDEAYRQDTNRYVRISNLLIVVWVFPNPTSDAAQVDAFVQALVAGLSA